jgi:hypothetical protein
MFIFNGEVKEKMEISDLVGKVQTVLGADR